MPWHPHSKILFLLCFVGLASFLAASIGLASDVWLIYSLSNNNTGDGNSTGVRVERVGVWKVCYRSDGLPDDGKRCQNIDYLSKVEKEDPIYQYAYPVFGKDLLLAFLILVMAGVVLVFVAEAIALICLKKRIKSLCLATAITFLIAGVVITAGLIVFTVRCVQLLSDWPIEELGVTPYDIVYFGWSFAITWVGAVLALFNSCGYIWLVRVQSDAMM